MYVTSTPWIYILTFGFVALFVFLRGETKMNQKHLISMDEWIHSGRKTLHDSAETVMFLCEMWLEMEIIAFISKFIFQIIKSAYMQL